MLLRLQELLHHPFLSCVNLEEAFFTPKDELKETFADLSVMEPPTEQPIDQHVRGGGPYLLDDAVEQLFQGRIKMTMDKSPKDKKANRILVEKNNSWDEGAKVKKETSLGAGAIEMPIRGEGFGKGSELSATVRGGRPKAPRKERKKKMEKIGKADAAKDRVATQDKETANSKNQGLIKIAELRGNSEQSILFLTFDCNR